MSPINIRKKQTCRWSSSAQHNAFGIQKWLCGRGFCVKEGTKYVIEMREYKDLLVAFLEKYDPSHSSLETKIVQKLETRVQKDFQKFCTFTINYFNR